MEAVKNTIDCVMGMENKELLMYLSPVLLIGFAKLISFVLSVVGFIWTFFLKPGRDPLKYGKWAVVTGATDGIGRAYCDQLASRKMNIVLISRTQEKLEKAAKEISDKYNVETKVIACDYSTADDEEYEMIKNELEPLDVGVLINNVGASHKWPERLDQQDEGTAQFLIDMNVKSTTRMCEVVLPMMKKKNKGCVVNMSSFSGGAFPTPLLATYAASKAYVKTFSEALNEEYKEFGVFVGVETPQFVVSKLSGKRYASMDTPTPKTYTAHAIHKLGQYPSISPYWYHALMINVYKMLPTAFLQGQMLKVNKITRVKAQNKAAKNPKKNKEQ